MLPSSNFILSHTSHASHLHYIPDPHHADILMLDDMAVEHGHTVVVHNRDEKGHTPPFRNDDDVFPGGDGAVERGIAALAAAYGKDLGGVDVLVEGVVHVALVDDFPYLPAAKVGHNPAGVVHAEERLTVDVPLSLHHAEGQPPPWQ